MMRPVFHPSTLHAGSTVVYTPQGSAPRMVKVARVDRFSALLYAEREYGFPGLTSRTVHQLVRFRLFNGKAKGGGLVTPVGTIEDDGGTL